jgi:hypothetical protein
MQKLLHKTENLIVHYYHLINDDSIVEPERNRRVLSVKNRLDNYSRRDIVDTASKLSKKKDAPYIFKIWCDMIVLTGKLD